MAVMSRAKKAKGQSWKIKNESKEVITTEKEDKPVTDEEHQKRIEKLKELGLIK